MSDNEYKVKSAHQVEKFQLGHSEDGAFLGLTFRLPSGKTLTVAVPFSVQYKFVEDVEREFEECKRRTQRRKDYAKPPED